MKLISKVFVACAVLHISASFPSEKANSIGTLDLRRYGKDVSTSPDKRTGKSLKEWTAAKKKGNPEEQGNYFEGDIIIDMEGRNGVVLAAQKWPNGKIPYEIVGTFSELVSWNLMRI
jgi:hypothetical protein